MATRKSPRTSPTEIFKNIYGVESAEDSPPVVVKFQRDLAKTINFNHEMERGDLKYAPSDKDKNPYYMCLHISQFAPLLGLSPSMLEWATPARYLDKSPVQRAIPNIELSAFFNISLKLFYDMAKDEVDWLALSCLKDPQVVYTSDIERNEEARILKKWLLQKDPINGKRYDQQDPIMEIEGEAERPPPLIYEAPPPMTSIDYEKVRWEISCEIAAMKARRAYIPVRHPRGWLVWVRLPDWSRDRQERRGQLVKLKKEFEKLWMYSTATDPEFAAGYRPRYSSADLRFPLYVVPAPDVLTLRLGWKAQQRDELFKGLVEAINNGKGQLQTELIVANGMQVAGTRFVKMGINPFGLFATYISADDFDTYMNSLETLNGYTDQMFVGKDAHRIQGVSNTDLKSWVKGHYIPKTTDYTTPQNSARKSVQEWKAQGGKLYSKEDECGSTWRIGVGREKIKDAGGKRIAKYSPKGIMGMSANDATEYAFGWKMLDQADKYLGHKHRLSNGMYMAEWLHLCAFSWGGLTMSPKKSKLAYRSSDIPENLIIGTSETNSVMTRFEKAWQALVRDEGDLTIQGVKNSSFSANLVVSRNRSTEHVIRDKKEYGRYSRTSSPISLAECSIAKLYHFVAYTVSYSIHFPKGCKLLAMGAGSSLETTFYPFLRPLYHRLEDQLDQMLYEKIKDRYLGDAISISAGISAMSIGQPIVDGTAPHGFFTGNGTGPYAIKREKGTRKKGNGRDPYNVAGDVQQGAGINPVPDFEDFEKVEKKLKTLSEDV